MRAMIAVTLAIAATSGGAVAQGALLDRDADPAVIEGGSLAGLLGVPGTPETGPHFRVFPVARHPIGVTIG